jgi:hypothetical protein
MATLASPNAMGVFMTRRLISRVDFQVDWVVLTLAKARITMRSFAKCTK